ncbi:MAG: hypothetical protein ABW032_11260 [Burkholderiaceae bacterium]
MPAPTIRPASDPLDDIDRETGGVDTAMTRQDLADVPGRRSDQPDAGRKSAGDVYVDATREVSQRSLDPDQDRLDADRELEQIVDGSPGSELMREALAPADIGLGADDDDPIDETERAGDDSLR